MQLTEQDAIRGRDQRFAARMHRMRTLGGALSALLVAAVLGSRDTPAWTWALWALNGFAWPQLAWWLSRRASDPRSVEFRNLVVDSAAGGFWIAAMGFSLVPGAVLASMLTMDKIAAGGWRFLARTAPAMLMAAGAACFLLDVPVRLQSDLSHVLGTLPFLFVYPAALAAVTFELGHSVARKNRQLQRLNRVDVLTGLRNRRGWNEAMAAELARHARTRRPAVLMLVDVDNLKEVNDTHGHLVGDEVLRSVADVLRECTREIDTPARYGGDEFGVLLAETDLAGALDVAERARTVFLSRRPAVAAEQACTLSIGLAEADLSVVTADEWLHRADAAMYRAKAGRNRVEADRPRVPVPGG